jgi:hypothetical protein
MTEEEFGALTLNAKWDHLKKTVDYILQMDSKYSSTENSFSLRRRYNPHHSPEQIEQETELLKQEQRNLRVDQYQRWGHIKNLYGAHRDELVNTLDSPDYEECKSILERVFTMEVDDALRDIIDG